MSDANETLSAAIALEWRSLQALRERCYEMVVARATWHEAPVDRQDLYRAWRDAKTAFELAEDSYVAARRDLIRWGVVK